MTGPSVVFLIVIALTTAGGLFGVMPARRYPAASSAVATNERITALAGAVLLVLAVAIGITIVRIDDLLAAHYLVGFLMLGPVGLKLATTGYRFVRYYTGSPTYRLAGPPQLLLRLSAPLLVLATIAVFGTGIELWLFGDRFGGGWFQAHVVSFLAWTVTLGIHLLGHTRESVDATWREVASDRAPQVLTRRGVLFGSLVFGALLAAVSLFYQSPFHLPNGPG